MENVSKENMGGLKTLFSFAAKHKLLSGTLAAVSALAALYPVVDGYYESRLQGERFAAFEACSVKIVSPQDSGAYCEAVLACADNALLKSDVHRDTKEHDQVIGIVTECGKRVEASDKKWAAVDMARIVFESEGTLGAAKTYLTHLEKLEAFDKSRSTRNYAESDALRTRMLASIEAFKRYCAELKEVVAQADSEKARGLLDRIEALPVRPKPDDLSLEQQGILARAVDLALSRKAIASAPDPGPQLMTASALPLLQPASPVAPQATKPVPASAPTASVSSASARPRYWVMATAPLRSAPLWSAGFVTVDGGSKLENVEFLDKSEWVRVKLEASGQEGYLRRDQIERLSD